VSDNEGGNLESGRFPLPRVEVLESRTIELEVPLLRGDYVRGTIMDDRRAYDLDLLGLVIWRYNLL
jgi:hypothetical protein